MENTNVELKSGRVWHYVSVRNIRWMNDPEVTKYLTHRGKVTYWRAFCYFLSHWRKGDILWAIYLRGKHIGNCGLFEIYQSSAQLKLMIGEKHWWGKGLGYLSISRILDRASEYGLKRIWLNVHPKNTRALRLYRIAGFIKESDITLPNGIEQIRMYRFV